MTDDGKCKPSMKKAEAATPSVNHDTEFPDAIPRDIAKKLGRRE